MVTLCPKLSAAISTHPQTQQEPCRAGDGSSTPASQRVLAVAVPPWQTSLPATLGLSVEGGQGKEAALLLLMGEVGVTAGRVSPPGSTVILRDAAELYGERQFPGHDTATHHDFM